VFNAYFAHLSHTLSNAGGIKEKKLNNYRRLNSIRTLWRYVV